jgi:hypothetical protein
VIDDELYINARIFNRSPWWMESPFLIFLRREGKGGVGAEIAQQSAEVPPKKYGSTQEKWTPKKEGCEETLATPLVYLVGRQGKLTPDLLIKNQLQGFGRA